MIDEILPPAAMITTPNGYEAELVPSQIEGLDLEPGRFGLYIGGAARPRFKSDLAKMVDT